MLCEAMRASGDLEVREAVVLLLWDLEAHNRSECRFEPGGCEAAVYMSVLGSPGSCVAAGLSVPANRQRLQCVQA
jgi:hypothetical protein